MTPFRPISVLAGVFLLGACGTQDVTPGSGQLSPAFARRTEQERARSGLPPGLVHEGDRVRPAPHGTGSRAEHLAQAEELRALGGREECAAALVAAWRVAPHDDRLPPLVASALRDAGYENAALGVLAGVADAADVLFARAELHWRAGRRGAARVELERALVLDSDHGQAHALLARAFFLAGEPDAARRAARDALAAGAQLPAALTSLAEEGR